jgi:hypothetical protein
MADTGSGTASSSDHEPSSAWKITPEPRSMIMLSWRSPAA